MNLPVTRSLSKITVIDPDRVLVERARSLVGTNEKTYSELVTVLTDIKSGGTVQRMGYGVDRAGFEAFLRDQLGGMGYRKALYLLAIGSGFRAAELPKETVDEIGLAKAAVIAKLPPSELREVAAFAADHTVAEVQAEVIRRRDPEAKQKRRMAFSFHEDQAELVQTALDLCAVRSRKSDPSQQLDLIIGEWLASQGSRISLAEAVRYLEGSYGVKVTVEEATP